MRIGKEYKPCEVKFGNGLKIGEAFYYRGEYDSKEELYMKIRYIEYDECHCDMVRYNLKMVPLISQKMIQLSPLQTYILKKIEVYYED